MSPQLSLAKLRPSCDIQEPSQAKYDHARSDAQVQYSIMICQLMDPSAVLGH